MQFKMKFLLLDMIQEDQRTAHFPLQDSDFLFKKQISTALREIFSFKNHNLFYKEQSEY